MKIWFFFFYTFRPWDVHGQIISFSPDRATDDDKITDNGRDKLKQSNLENSGG